VSEPIFDACEKEANQGIRGILTPGEEVE